MRRTMKRWDILHKAASQHLVSRSGPMLSEIDTAREVLVDNDRKLLFVPAMQNKRIAFPFEWVIDHDVLTLDANGQRESIVSPNLALSLEVEKAEFRSESSTDVWLDVAWRKKATPRTALEEQMYVVSAPPKIGRSSSVRLENQLEGAAQELTVVPFLPTYTSSSLEFYDSVATQKVVWNSRSIRADLNRVNPPLEATVSAATLNPTKKRKDILTTLEKYGFAVVLDPSLASNTGKTTAEVVANRKASAEELIVDTFSVMRNSHYGMMSQWSSDDDWKRFSFKDQHRGVKSPAAPAAAAGEDSHQDGAYSSTKLDLHTDGTYFVDCPKVQGFGCIFSVPGQTIGGETTLVDGFAVAAAMAERFPHHLRTLCSVPVGGRYWKEGRCYESYRSVITARPMTEALTVANIAQYIERISFNNSDRIGMTMGDANGLKTSRDLRAFYAAYYKFHELVHSPEFCIAFLLQPGQLLFFDNHRTLHGRLGFSGPRVMCGAYVGTDEYYSALKHVETAY